MDSAPAAPILVVGFRRPEEIKRVFSAISRLSRRHIYVFCDGPQDAEDIPLQLEIWKAAQSLDGDFFVHTSFQKNHLGLRNGVLQAVDWFFAHEEEGIILEDDIVPNPDFFRFCESALDKFRPHTQIQQVVGSNVFGTTLRGSSRHFLSARMDCWGWATWKNRWNEFRISSGDLGAKVGLTWAPRSMVKEIRSAHIAALEGRIDSWAYSWAWHALARKQLSVVAVVNLTKNVGFGGRATHTKNGRGFQTGRLSGSYSFPSARRPDLLFVYGAEILKSNRLRLGRAKRRCERRWAWAERFLGRVIGAVSANLSWLGVRKR